MGAPTGFTYTVRKGGEVVIRHNGREAAVLRGARTIKFLRDVDCKDAQALMTRITGNYKRGNERR